MFDGLARLYPDLSVRHLPTNVMAEPDEVLMHFPLHENWEWPPVSRSQADRLRAAFSAHYGGMPEVNGGKLFLTRRSAKLRQLRNGDEIEEKLAREGFEIFQARDDNHAEQVAKFYAADIVVSVHGAGLTNLLFCRPGTRVIEIFPANQVKSTYWWICRHLGLHHVPVIAGQGDYHLHFHVDWDAINEAIIAPPA